MGIDIREADLVADRELLLNILLRNRDHGDNERRRARFEWSYYQNRFATPRAWLAIDSSSSRVIGMVAAFPRKMKVNGVLVQAWNGGDTSIDREFRTLGVAIKLRRAVQEAVDRQEMTFLYSHPVDRMRVVLEKIGHQTIGKFIRHGVLLRTDLVVQKALGRNLLADWLAGVANFATPLQWSHRFGQNGLSVKPQTENTFDGEFDDLCERVCRCYPVITVRDAEFLHWRFTSNPLAQDFRVFRLEREDKLAGYAIVGFENAGARIWDILVDGDGRAIRTLLLGVIRWLRRHKICTLALRATASSPILAEARPLGFWFQDHTNAGVAVYTADPNLTATVMNESNWFMTQADRDV